MTPMNTTIQRDNLRTTHPSTTPHPFVTLIARSWPTDLRSCSLTCSHIAQCKEVQVALPRLLGTQTFCEEHSRLGLLPPQTVLSRSAESRGTAPLGGHGWVVDEKSPAVTYSNYHNSMVIAGIAGSRNFEPKQELAKKLRQEAGGETKVGVLTDAVARLGGHTAVIAVGDVCPWFIDALGMSPRCIPAAIPNSLSHHDRHWCVCVK